MAKRRSLWKAASKAVGKRRAVVKRRKARAAPRRTAAHHVEAHSGLRPVERAPIDEQTALEQAAEQQGMVGEGMAANEPSRPFLGSVHSTTRDIAGARETIPEHLGGNSHDFTASRPAPAARAGAEPERREAARLDARTLARELVLGALRFAGALLLAPLRIAFAILRSRG
jgi:hypothetical protein